MVPGGGATNHVIHVILFQDSLLAAPHKVVRKGTLIDDSVWPEENDIGRRFLSEEGAAFTLLFRFENRQVRERSELGRDEKEPVGLVVIKSPAVFILIREIDDLQRENTSMISKEQGSLCEFYRGHFCLGNPRGRVVFINMFVGRHENLFYCKYSLEMKTRCNE